MGWFDKLSTSIIKKYYAALRKQTNASPGEALRLTAEKFNKSEREIYDIINS